MADRDGNGWVTCDLGHRHWGIFGAAGLLAWMPGRPAEVLLHQRGFTVHHPGTWGPPGGARDSHEDAVEAALREAAEECGVPPDAVRPSGVLLDDHGGWSYQTVLAAATEPFAVRLASIESEDVAWIREPGVTQLMLHPGFAATWPVLRQALEPVTVIVDVANVMGARADGWWRDRAGAASRLYGEVAGLARQGVAGENDAGGLGGPLGDGPGLTRWFPGWVLVLEGRARAALAELPELEGAAVAPGRGGVPDAVALTGQLTAVAAPGSGDDLIARLAGEISGRRLVVTADWELRRRVVAAGAAVTGPRWLLGRLGPAAPGRPGRAERPGR